MTWTEYRLALQIQTAKRLLLDPNLRGTEVASQAGFDSITYLNRVFRRVAGCSPTEYRALQNANPGVARHPRGMLKMPPHVEELDIDCGAAVVATQRAAPVPPKSAT